MQNFNQIKNFGNYQIVDFVGSGATGVVYKCINIQNGELNAVKMISKSRIKHLEYLETEINLIQRLQNPFIVKFKDYQEHNRQCFLILEYMENGSLADMIKNIGTLKEQLIKKVIFQILQGLQYLHKNNIIHRDIKGANILLDKNFEAKLSDFGVAKILEDEKDNNQNSFVGTPYWMAPEMINPKAPPTSKADIWSLGCTVIECITGKPPYADLNQYNAFFKIVEENSPEIPKDISLECQDFLKQCFQKQPEQRSSANELVKHKWFNSLFKNRARLKSRNSIQLKNIDKQNNTSCQILQTIQIQQNINLEQLQQIKEYYDNSNLKKLESLDILFNCNLYYDKEQQDQINFKLLEIIEVLSNHKSNENQLFFLIEQGVLDFIFNNIDLDKSDLKFSLRAIALLGHITLLEKNRSNSYLSLPIYLKKFIKIFKFSNLENLQKNQQILNVSINICLNTFYENLKKNYSIFACETILKQELVIYLMIWLNLNWGNEYQEQLEIKILDIFLIILQLICKEKDIEQKNKLLIYIQQEFIIEVLQKEFNDKVQLMQKLK